MRAFTDKERSVIDAGLRSTGRTLFARQGWKKTGIDDLCRAAGIARGTFYHFYASKDAFFLSLLAEAEVQVKKELLDALSDPQLSAEASLRHLLTSALTVIDRHPLLRFAFADPEEPAPWLRALEGESMEVLARGDDETAAAILGVLAAKGRTLALSAADLAGLLRALVLLPLSRSTIGPPFETVRSNLIGALVRGLE